MEERDGGRGRDGDEREGWEALKKKKEKRKKGSEGRIPYLK